MVVEDRVRRRPAADHGDLVLLSDRYYPAGSGVIRGPQQHGVVVVRDEVLRRRRRDRWPALVVDDVEAEPVAGSLKVDATLIVDPILAVEVSLLGHLAVHRLATSEGDDRPDRNGTAQRRADDGRAGGAGGSRRARRDQGREGKPGPPHVA